MTDPPRPPPDDNSATTTTTNDGTSPFVSPDTQGGPPITPTETSFGDPLPFHGVDTETIVSNAKVFARKQLTSTPSGRQIIRKSLDLDIKEQKTVLENELVHSMVARDRAFASSLYHHVASGEKIDEFFKKTKVFDSARERWKLPGTHQIAEEKDMYKPLVRLLNAIVEYFWKERAKELRIALSKVIDTNTTNLCHVEAVETDHYSRPDISVKAGGPSFQLPHKKTKGSVGFSNMATCFEVKIEKQRLGFLKELLQVAVYARQIFIQQPNRRFVRLLLITEQQFRLFHFDRSGVQYTEEIDLHSEATRHIFVRLVLGLCSPYESDLGLDTSVQWVTEKGRKVRGTLKAQGPDGAIEEYKLATIEPIQSSFNIRGQSTTYWSVIDPKGGGMLLVKDSWRSGERVSEREFLEKAQNSAGVVRMISCEENREETKHFRGFGDNEQPPTPFYNRISMRVLMDCEGKLIQGFTSPMQLVCALRDAIAAHQKLFELDIVHRDISAYNIALGKPGAEVGSRGILLGLDMAIYGAKKRNFLTTGDNGRSDDRAYWSIVMLLNADPARTRIAHPIAHDYLDDLEAFVYVLGRIIYEFDANGKRLTCPNDIQGWSLQAPADVAGNKEGFLARTKLSCQAEKHWPAPCKKLLINLGGFLKQFSEQKIELSDLPSNVKTRVDALKAMLSGIDKYYDTIFGYFDKAIRDLQEEEDKGHLILQTPAYSIVSSSAINSPAASERTASQPSPSQGDLQTYQSSLKRILEESPDDHPEAKREHYESPPSPTPAPRGRAARRARRQG